MPLWKAKRHYFSYPSHIAEITKILTDSYKLINFLSVLTLSLKLRSNSNLFDRKINEVWAYDSDLKMSLSLTRILKYKIK